MSIKRAILLIGVQNAAGMPPLRAAWDGVYQMKDWALSQGFAPELVKVITDQPQDNRQDAAQRPEDSISIGYVKRCVKAFTKRGDLDQLLIYYSGHGMNISFNEYWLLSDALDDGTEAVNVKGSMEAATYGGVPHVIFISDACRSAAATTAHQSIVPGSLIFPKKFHQGLSKDVDVFYATLLGDPAMEIADADDASNRYSAIYTEALLEALSGLHPEILKQDGGTGPHYVRPRPLKKFLQNDLPIRVIQRLGLADGRSQQPDARITSGDEAWLSQISDVLPTDGPRKFGGSSPPAADILAHAEATEFLADLPLLASREAVAGKSDRWADLVHQSTQMRGQLKGATTITSMTDAFVREVNAAADFDGQDHFKAGCGFQIRGAVIQKAISSVPTEVFENGSLIVVHLSNQPAASVLLQLGDGSGLLIPGINGFICKLTVRESGLSDVAYEPVLDSYRRSAFNEKAAHIRHLRATASAASRQGVFRLDGDDAENMARQMQLAKGIDPSLALYAAHAYRDQGNRSRLQQMADYLSGDLNFCPFDIALLAGRLGPDASKHDREQAYPHLPMLSQTWALLPAYDISLPSGLENIERDRRPESLWTAFTSKGSEKIAAAINNGDLT